MGVSTFCPCMGVWGKYNSILFYGTFCDENTNLFIFVGNPGLEPGTSRSRTVRLTN